MIQEGLLSAQGSGNQGSEVKHPGLGASVSTPRFSLFPLQQLSLTASLVKVILEEMLLDLKEIIITFTNDLVIVFIASQWSVKCSKRQHRTISFDGEVLQRLIAPDPLTSEWYWTDPELQA